MESELLAVADSAVSQPGILGYICVDKEGLCLAVKGQIQQSMSGVIHQIAELANKIEESQHSNEQSSSQTPRVPPVIRVDMEGYKMTIQSRNSITTALLYSKK